MSIIQDLRLGRFRIGVEMINYSPDSCRAIFAKVIVLDATVNLASNDIEYVAICDAFAPIKAGDEVPLYSPSLTIHRDDDGNVSSVELVGWI